MTNSNNVSRTAPVSRRTLLERAALAGIGVSVLMATPALAGQMPQQPEAETGKSYPMPKPTAKNEKMFRMGVMPIATLSMAASKIAVGKATAPEAKKFANFELREAIGISTVLKEMNTPTPPMSAMDKTTLDKLKAAEGAEFDKAYMTAQLGAHEYLRDLAESFIGSTNGTKNMAEMHGRHLAIVSLATFKEHIVHCKDFLATTA